MLKIVTFDAMGETGKWGKNDSGRVEVWIIDAIL